jgi:glycosyltransferase involved in cell wall biosynthesis
LIDAFVSATDSGEAILLFVGDGRQRGTLEDLATKYGRDDDIRFAGFQNQGELPRYYEIADLFVLPSAQENWGLVVNEAMNFGLPIITTNVVGCASDLVDDSNGRVVPVDDVPALSRAIVELLRDPKQLEVLGRNSLDIIDNWGIDEAGDGIVMAANYAANQHRE